MSPISLDEARRLLLGDVPVLASERVALDQTLGRTLAEALVASHTQPAEPRATMDGIAVADAEPALGAEWRLVGDAAAGVGALASLGGGEAIRIGTGAVVPEGAARVLPQELLQYSADRATLASRPSPARCIREAGADFAAGDRLLEPGVRIGPAELGMIAAANCSSAEVVREPKVTICTAGDELVAPGSALRDGQSVDSASHMLAALVRRWGGVPRVCPILPDDLEAIASALRNGLESCDILLCIGGASVGRRDLMRPAARALGAQFRFEGIAVQPGKPCWHARSETGQPILGLPGNPSSVFVCAHLLLLPFMETLMNRAPVEHARHAYAATPLPANGDREQYLRATASHDPAGRLWAEALPDQDSGLQAALARAQLLIRRVPGAQALERGDSLEVVDLAGA